MFVDGVYVGRVYRQQGWGRADPRGLPLPSSVPRLRRLSILVENLGRVGFVDLPWSSPAYTLDQRKGILGGVLLNGTHLQDQGGGWATTCLPLDAAQIKRIGELDALQWQDIEALAEAAAPPSSASKGQSKPVGAVEMFRGLFTLPARDAGADAFVLLTHTGLVHGAVWINGWNLGRFWEREGPQHSLYVPGPLLKSGENEVLVFSVDPLRGVARRGGRLQVNRRHLA